MFENERSLLQRHNCSDGLFDGKRVGLEQLNYASEVFWARSEAGNNIHLWPLMAQNHHV